MNEVQQKYAEVLNSYNTVSLSDLESLKLLNRFDTKYIIHKDDLITILNFFKNDLKILEINQKRVFNYHNVYFDTEDNLFFNQHHNGKRDRFKIRYRHYVDAGTTYFEIKHKLNNSLTTKKRIKIDNIYDFIGSDAKLLIQNETAVNPEEIFSRVFVDYERITLVNEDIPEKITIDLNINFLDSVNKYSLSDVALIELKQKKINHNSTTFQLLKRMNIQPISGFSKYCMAMIYTHNVMKFNRFKQKVMLIEKILEQNNGS